MSHHMTSKPLMVLVGPPGCGKSCYVCRDDRKYYKPRGPWWDGYDSHPNVVIDDFYGWISYDELLRVCDRYPCKVPVKGTFVEFVSKWTFFTSNKHVWEWYSFETFDPAAILRKVFLYYVWDDADNKFVNLDESPMFDVVTMRYNY